MENNEYITLKEGTVKLPLNRFTNAIAEKCMHLNMDLYTAFEKCYSHYENKNWEAEPPLEEWKEDIMCFKKEWESIEKMKASELIQYLQNKVGEHGDFEIYKESWNHYDAIYEGLYPYHLCLSFYDKEKLKKNEADNTEDLCDKYRHPDRDIYKNMKEGEVVAVVMR